MAEQALGLSGVLLRLAGSLPLGDIGQLPTVNRATRSLARRLLLPIDLRVLGEIHVPEIQAIVQTGYFRLEGLRASPGTEQELRSILEATASPGSLQSLDLEFSTSLTSVAPLRLKPPRAAGFARYAWRDTLRGTPMTRGTDTRRARRRRASA